MNSAYLVATIALTAMVTFVLRILPILLKQRAIRCQKWFEYLGAVMPVGIMVVLAIYCVLSLHWQSIKEILVSVSALLALLFIEHRYRRPAFSICLALAVYVGGQRVGFL